MTIPNASPEDAVRIYGLAIAYLFNAAIDSRGPDTAMVAKEMEPSVFHLWRREQPAKYKGPVIPLAKCTFNHATQTWRVVLTSGETLQLLDKGDVWDIVKERKKN